MQQQDNVTGHGTSSPLQSLGLLHLPLLPVPLSSSLLFPFAFSYPPLFLALYFYSTVYRVGIMAQIATWVNGPLKLGCNTIWSGEDCVQL